METDNNDFDKRFAYAKPDTFLDEERLSEVEKYMLKLEKEQDTIIKNYLKSIENNND